MEKEGKSGAKVLILGNVCFRCGHKWLPYNIEEQQKVCPKCKSPYWDKPKVRFNKGANKNERNK